jgi:pimeloyl-ACP methyl ester carboxylesterase
VIIHRGRRLIHVPLENRRELLSDTNTAVSSSRLYWNLWQTKLTFFDVKNVSIPVAVSAFPDELYQAPRSWAEQAYSKLIHYNKLDKGGHFAAWEQPQLFSEEVRAGFRSLRK